MDLWRGLPDLSALRFHRQRRTGLTMRNAVRSLRWVAIAITVAISLAYLVVPVYSSGDTVIESNGWWVVVLLLLPVVTVLLPYALSEGRRHAAEGGAAAL